jgi:hypothetical protein
VVEVEGTDEFSAWYYELQRMDRVAVAYVVELLQERGVALGYPYSSKIRGSEILRELRVQSRGQPLRVFYAFDPLRQAILLIGGNKSGDKRFYKKFVPQAEKLYAEYLEELRQEKKLK